MNTKRPRQLTTSRPLLRCAALSCAAAMLTSSSQAAFHLWNIRELYTNGDGSLQFIEFFTTSSSQQFVGGQQINTTNGVTHTFTIPSNLTADSFNRAFLIGTATLAANGGPTPDYVMPNNFLFAAGGTISFFGANSGAYSALPTNGTLSYTYPAGTTAANTPQNFAGSVGSVPEPTSWALLGIGGAGFCFMLRRRTA